MATSTDTAVKRDALVERLTRATAGVFDVYTTYLGARLGLYRALEDAGPSTSTELARRSGTHERYVREWLEQQTVVGTLEVDDPCAGPHERRYHLPVPHAEVLLDRDSPSYLAPLVQLILGTVRPFEGVLEAFRGGHGVPFGEFGADMREGQGGLNRTAFLEQLGQVWLPSMPDVHARLVADPPARVAEVGCGVGWASIGLARAYGRITVNGFDLDAPSVDRARTNARAMGVADRVSFAVRHAGDAVNGRPFDLVLALECIHDMAAPVAALRAMRAMAGEHGAVLVMDERVGESFAERNEHTEWFMYGFSVLHCLPASMAESPSAATGTVMRPATLRAYAVEAGFRDVHVLPIETAFYTFYRLTA